MIFDMIMAFRLDQPNLNNHLYPREIFVKALQKFINLSSHERRAYYRSKQYYENISDCLIIKPEECMYKIFEIVAFYVDKDGNVFLTISSSISGVDIGYIKKIVSESALVPIGRGKIKTNSEGINVIEEYELLGFDLVDPELVK